MDTVDRSRRAAVAAARDAAGRARMLAEGLEALARALDTMAVELPHEGSPEAGVGAGNLSPRVSPETGEMSHPRRRVQQLGLAKVVGVFWSRTWARNSGPFAMMA